MIKPKPFEALLKDTVSISDINDAVIPPWRALSLVARIFRQWFPDWWRPPVEVIVFEHSEGDWDRGRCTGDPICAWRVTRNGPVEIEPDTSIDQSSIGPWYRDYSIFRFCVSPDRTRIILSRLHGPRAGSGATYQIDVKNGRFALINPASRAIAICSLRADFSLFEGFLVNRFVDGGRVDAEIATFRS